jgi:hypothetical protein
MMEKVLSDNGVASQSLIKDCKAQLHQPSRNEDLMAEEPDLKRKDLENCPREPMKLCLILGLLLIKKLPTDWLMNLTMSKN